MRVPVIDLSVATPEQLVEALTRSSCVFVTHHGLTDVDLAGLLGTAQEFFALPEEQKELVQWSGEGPWQGWQPVHRNGPTAMLLERFEIALAPGQAHLPAAEWAATFDQWPAEPPGLPEAWTRAYAVLHALASQLTTMIARGLGLPEDDLPAWTTQQFANLVVNYYPAQVEPPVPGQVRQRAHTDIGGITLLWAQQSGLEARLGTGGTWVPVDIPPGCLLLQAGDLLRLWSRGRLPANEHRVVNPPREPGAHQVVRWSAVYFHHPDLTTWVAPEVGARDHVLLRQETSMREEAQG